MNKITQNLLSSCLSELTLSTQSLIQLSQPDIKLAPIVLFTYNRKDLTEKTVNALKNNELAAESELFVFADGPKPGQENSPKILELREYLKTISGFKKITLYFKEHNLGLGNSIIAGVTEIVNKYGKIIVLEDDLITSRYFLRYMNDALNIYSQCEDVVCVSGYVFPIRQSLPNLFFIRGADCWGWATWKRGWSLFNSNGQELLDEINNRNLSYSFDFDGCYPYTQMLRDQIAGRNSSWAVRWMASSFLRNKLCLYPGHSLINNAGFTNDATNCHTDIDPYITEITDKPIEVSYIIPNENPQLRQLYGEFNRSAYIKLVYDTNYKKLPFEQQFSIALNYANNNNNHFALYITNMLIEHNAQFQGLNLLQGYCLFNTGQHQDGITAINKELQLFPDNTMAKNLLGQINNIEH